jgi:hypothetical protein
MASAARPPGYLVGAGTAPLPPQPSTSRAYLPSLRRPRTSRDWRSLRDCRRGDDEQRARGRLSYDAPIRSADDIGATPLAARVVNVKPSRIRSLRELFEIYARCARDQRPMYGGGMAELGVGRGQIELLAALFHADAPNDVAPSAYNEEDPPGDLPASPLTPQPEAIGFRWDGVDTHHHSCHAPRDR